MRNRPSHAARVCGGVAALAVVAWAMPTLAQLAVLSTVPTDGATLVDTASTVVITFNAPLDTSARFPWPPGFFLGLSMSPEPREPDSVSVSTDLTTVRIHNLHLAADTRYVLAVLGARSSTGASLQVPAVITFTTGAALPTAAVSGTITLPGGDPSGTLVALFPALMTVPEAMGVVQASSGAYQINYVPPGVYFPMALKDIDHSGDADPDPAVDLVAIYDPNGDGVADQIVVAEGAATTGIEMTLSAFAPLTARQRHTQASSLALSRVVDARLVMVACQALAPDGKSPFWLYLFYAPAHQEVLGVIATSFFLAPFFWAEELPDTTALPDDWVDSTVAADSAEAHGGADFRSAHPDAHAAGALAHIDLPASPVAAMGKAKGASRGAWSGGRSPCLRKVGTTTSVRSAGPRYASLGQPACPADALPVWVVQYSSDLTGDFLVIALDAQSARPVFIWPPQTRTTTASFNVPAANQAAQRWAGDAQLVWLGTHAGTFTPSGEAEMWFYAYYSPSLDSARAFFFSAGTLFAEMGGPLPFKQPLPTGWVDSPVAAAVGEANGGNAYRSTHQDVWVEAMLASGLYPWDSVRPVWAIHYTSSAPEELWLWVDARSAQLLTDVGSHGEDGKLPQRFGLSQNFPNPFNPETAITYQLPVPLDVELSILNVRGERVATLVDGFRGAGYHKVHWDGKDDSGRPVAAGVYFCQLRTQGLVAVRKMLLLR